IVLRSISVWVFNQESCREVFVVSAFIRETLFAFFVRRFRKYLYEKKKVGEKVEVTFYRNGQKMTKTATLADNSATKNQ
ncbi:hypothetical protein ACT7CZ_03230, partial [Bacillus cereus]